MDPYQMQNVGEASPFMGKALGSVIGGAIGGTSGAATGGKIGGSLGSLIRRPMQSRAAKQLKTEAESLFPQYEDPRQLAQLARLQQMQKSLETGAEFQGARDAAMQNVAGTQAGIVRSTGGDVGSALQGLLQSQRVGGQQINQAYGQAAERRAQLTPLEISLGNLISARKMELGLAQSQQKMAEWAKMQQQLNQNLRADLARGETGDTKYLSPQNAFTNIFDEIKARREQNLLRKVAFKPKTNEQMRQEEKELGLEDFQGEV